MTTEAVASIIRRTFDMGGIEMNSVSIDSLKVCTDPTQRLRLPVELDEISTISIS